MMVYDPERKRGLLRLSKRDGVRTRVAMAALPQLPQRVHLQQRSLRLSKRANTDSLRLSRRSDTSGQGGQPGGHKLVIRLSKRQLADLVSLKRTLASMNRNGVLSVISLIETRLDRGLRLSK